ncbi:unnamed protein product [Polarella glacialis]|uniref:Amino acid transporter transmembrane domain-containing protein n=1 Tax=Polarella glacialis TaxID=89957 RepID=A0A813DEU0_POLGL|nr:unnamed protein product [Polarella glacialis]CAE8679265.1 unnamed protein product [Polarella glacialis]
MFCLPLALQQGSVLPGLAAMLAVCLASGSSFMLLAYLCEKLYGQSYRDIWAASLGPKTSVIVDFSIVANGLAVCMLYQVLVADLVQQAAAALFGVADLSRSLIVWVNAVLIIAPLCHLRNLSALRYTSITGLCLVLGVFAYVVSDFFGHWQVATSNLVAGAFHLDRGIFSMVAISVGAFQAHYNSPRFFKELGCNLQQHSRMTIIAYTLTFAIYSIFAVAGMGLFGSSTTGNVLKNYAAAGSSVVVAGWVGTIFNMNFTYPLVFVSARNSLISMVPALEKANEKRPRAAHVAITCSMLVVTSCAACLTDDISFVTGMLGAFALLKVMLLIFVLVLIVLEVSCCFGCCCWCCYCCCGLYLGLAVVSNCEEPPWAPASRGSSRQFLFFVSLGLL